ncbi:OmpA family protein [Novosphingobium resinovorum]|uniref:OmpA family protein n=1 Tax=Novosphingobium resinovorum TaxID=158500 RepID=UPI003D275EF6
MTLNFRDRYGWLTRHPVLSGGRDLSPETRKAVAAAIAAVPGIAGVSWARDGDDRSVLAHCQDDVERILETRTIRFGEASTRLEPSSERLLGEVARSLRPCVGSIIAVTGHTDASGNQKVNVALSQARAEAVRSALIARGIPATNLRAAGLGSARRWKGWTRSTRPIGASSSRCSIPRRSSRRRSIRRGLNDGLEGLGKDAALPLWLEMAVSVLLSYGIGFGIGAAIWNRRR